MDDFICSPEAALSLARGLRKETQSTHALVILMSFVQKEEDKDASANVYIAIQSNDASADRFARLPGTGEWSRLGAAELAMDCLRRFLLKQPIYQKIDFEQH